MYPIYFITILAPSFITIFKNPVRYFPWTGYFWTFSVEMGVGSGPGQRKRTPRKDKLSFVPQWTMNTVTLEWNSNLSCLSCLNRRKSEGGGVEETSQGSWRQLPGQAVEKYFVNLHLGTYLSLSYLSKQNFKTQFKCLLYFKYSLVLHVRGRSQQSNVPLFNYSNDILSLI